MTFWPHPRGCWCVQWQYICFHGALCSIPFNLICNMTTFRKRYSLTFWPHPLGQGCVCEQNICYHIAASVVSFNLICNMTTFRKDIVWPFDPTPWVEGVSVGKIFATMLLLASSALIWYATWPNSEKVQFWPLPVSPPNWLGPRPSNWNPVWNVS